MANKFTYDTAAKLFILEAGVTTLELKAEFYSWVKFDWKTDDDLNKFRFPIDSIGGQDIGGGVSVSPYYSLRHGWRIRPAEENGSISVVGNLITDTGDDPFVGTVGTWDTVIKYVVSGNSLTTAAGGGSGLTASDIWDLTNGVEASLTPREALRLIVAASAGKLAGADGTQISIRDINDTKDRIVATVDEHGNRTAVTTDGT